MVYTIAILIYFVFDNYAWRFHVIKYIWSQMSKYQRRRTLGLPYWNMYLKMGIIVNSLPEFYENLQIILNNLNYNPRRNRHHGSVYFVKEFHCWFAVGPGIESFLSASVTYRGHGLVEEHSDLPDLSSIFPRQWRGWDGGSERLVFNYLITLPQLNKLYHITLWIWRLEYLFNDSLSTE